MLRLINNGDKMRDVTYLMDTYRECVRHLWNTDFLRDAQEKNDWDLKDEFDDASAILFHAFDLRRLNREDIEFTPDY